MVVHGGLICGFILLCGRMEAKVVVHIGSVLGLLIFLSLLLLLVVVLFRNADIGVLAQLKVVVAVGPILGPSCRLKLARHNRSSHSLQLEV